MRHKIITVGLFVLLIAALIILSELPSAHQKYLEQREKYWTDSVKKLNDKIKENAERDSLLNQQAKKERRARIIAQMQLEAIAHKYAKERNKPVVHLSDAGIDSALARLYPR